MFEKYTSAFSSVSDSTLRVREPSTCGPLASSFPIPLVPRNKQATIRYKPSPSDGLRGFVLRSRCQSRSTVLLSINHFVLVILCCDPLPLSPLQRFAMPRSVEECNPGRDRGYASWRRDYAEEQQDDTLFDLWLRMPRVSSVLRKHALSRVLTDFAIDSRSLATCCKLLQMSG